MSRDPFAHIEHVRVQDGPNTYQAQRIACSHEGCSETLDFRKASGNRPPEAIRSMALNKGWKADVNKGNHLCPAHNPKHKEPDMAHTSRPLPKPAPTTTIFREMTVKDRRAIFREIDDNYDESRASYVFEVTDKTIGEKLGVPWAWVANIRDDNFGPAGPDPKITEALEQIETLTKEVRAAELKAIEAAERADHIGLELGKMKARLGKLL